MKLENDNLLSTILENDAIYQNLLTACTESEADYLRIRESLSANDQAQLERYISLCEELDHRKLQLALKRFSPQLF